MEVERIFKPIKSGILATCLSKKNEIPGTYGKNDSFGTGTFDDIDQKEIGFHYETFSKVVLTKKFSIRI
jgi:hypothetical protein